MEIIHLEQFRNSIQYHQLSNHSKRAIVHLSLDNISISKSLLNAMIALDQGRITNNEFLTQAIQRALT